MVYNGSGHMEGTEGCVDGNETYTIELLPAESLLVALLRDGRMTLNPSCGGHGTCARCMVICKDNRLSPLSLKERLRLGPQLVGEGWRIACLVSSTVFEPIFVTITR